MAARCIMGCLEANTALVSRSLGRCNGARSIQLSYDGLPKGLTATATDLLASASFISAFSDWSYIGVLPTSPGL